jgi:hypothetical protein
MAEPEPRSWPDPPTDPDRAFYDAARAMPEVEGIVEINGKQKSLRAHGIELVMADPTRYEARYGPGSAARDAQLLGNGADRAIRGELERAFDHEGPTVDFDDYQSRIEAGLLYANVLAKLPPEPDKNHPLYGGWKNLASEALRRELRNGQSGGAIPEAPPFITLAETRDLETTDEDYVIADGLLTRGGKLMLYAYAGAGKTTLLDHMAASLASGRPFLGVHHVDRPHKVLYVQGELTQSEIASHGQDLLEVFAETSAAENLVFWRNTQLPLPEGEDRIRAALKETCATMLILDPFNRFFRGDNSWTQEQIGELFRMLDRLLEDAELGLDGVIISHHMNVSKARMAGSYDFEGWPSTILRLDVVTTDANTRKLTYEKIRAPGSTYIGQTRRIELSDRGYIFAADEAHAEPFAGPNLIHRALEDLGGEAYRRELITRGMAKTNSKERAVAGYVTHAVRQGLIEKVEERGAGRQAIYRVINKAAEEAE